MNYYDIQAAISAYQRGENVTELLRKKLGLQENTSEIIELAYDLQAGSYVEYMKSNFERVSEYSREIANFIHPFVTPETSVVDVGTGELTTLSLILSKLPFDIEKVLAFDISWSRLCEGLEHWDSTVQSRLQSPRTFVADMKAIPLASKSIDVIISCHALEPNRGSLPILLRELFRICRYNLVLFEPSYEHASAEVQARMDRLGYIRDIPSIVSEMGGRIVDILPLHHSTNPLNPTFCHVIEPSECTRKPVSHAGAEFQFTAPGTDFLLTEQDRFFVSSEAAIAFPIFKDIPILKIEAGILATKLVKG